jgi:Domain of unknown function (DUF4185)
MRRFELLLCILFGSACATPLHGSSAEPTADSAPITPLATGCRPFGHIAQRLSGAIRSLLQGDHMLFVADEGIVDSAPTESLMITVPANASISDCLASATLATGKPSSALPSNRAPTSGVTASGISYLYDSQPCVGYGIAAIGSASDTMLWTADRTAYGTAVVKSEGNTYVYGCQSARFLDADCYLARVPDGSITVESAYAYYVGGGHWSPRVDDAWPLTSAGTSIDVAWSPQEGRWLMLYVTPLGDTLTLRAGLHPEGPWSAPKVVARCDLADADMFCTGVRIHADVATSPRAIIISYAAGSLSSDAGARRIAEPDKWWPRLFSLAIPALP